MGGYMVKSRLSIRFGGYLPKSLPNGRAPLVTPAWQGGGDAQFNASKQRVPRLWPFVLLCPAMSCRVDKLSTLDSREQPLLAEVFELRL